jgi:hypothetical protein
MLPEPTGLALEERTTTSLEIKWDLQAQLQASPHSSSTFWFVQFCKSDDTEILGDCIFPLSVSQAPVKGLQPGCEYKISLRLELRPAATSAPTVCSAWSAHVFSTQDVVAAPLAPPRPVVARVSSTVAEVTILASPCCKDWRYTCAQSYLLQRLEGSLPSDGSREDEWKSVPEVTTSCSHPKSPEIVPSLEKKKVPLAADRTYHFRVRAANSRGASAWSEVATTLAPPASPEVRLELVKSDFATLVWTPSEDHGFAVRCYHIYQCRADDEDNVKTTTVSVPSSAKPPSKRKHQNANDESTALKDALTYHAQGLQPNSSFKFWVRAVSDAGQSDPSAPLYVVTQPLPPPQPCALSVTAVRPNAMTVTWSIERMNEMNRVSACEVCWREVCADSVATADEDDLERFVMRHKLQGCDGEIPIRLMRISLKCYFYTHCINLLICCFQTHCMNLLMCCFQTHCMNLLMCCFQTHCMNLLMCCFHTHGLGMCVGVIRADQAGCTDMLCIHAYTHTHITCIHTYTHDI